MSREHLSFITKLANRFFLFYYVVKGVEGRTNPSQALFIGGRRDEFVFVGGERDDMFAAFVGFDSMVCQCHFALPLVVQRLVSISSQQL